jgi:hypothetical protein
MMTCRTTEKEQKSRTSRQITRLSTENRAIRHITEVWKCSCNNQNKAQTLHPRERPISSAPRFSQPRQGRALFYARQRAVPVIVTVFRVGSYGDILSLYCCNERKCNLPKSSDRVEHQNVICPGGLDAKRCGAPKA